MRTLSARLIFAFLLACVASSAADLTGIWTGKISGRNDVTEDISFQFKHSGTALTGTMFGDEFDLKLEEGSVTAEQVKFIVTTTNYYSGTKAKFVYTGVIKDAQIDFTIERLNPPPAGSGGGGGRGNMKRTFTLKRLT